MAVSLINRSTAIFILLFSICSLAHAVDRNSVTNKFNWGDDLSETPYTSDCPAGTLNCTQAPPTQFKSTHLPDIKQAIDLSVTACSITSDVYLQTDREAISQIGYPGKLVSSTHVNNLRRAIEELYRQKSQPPPAYLSGDVTTGTPILKAHINDMRRALDELVVTCSLGACWQHPNPIAVCLVYGSCSPVGSTTVTKCKDSDGNFQAGHTLYCQPTGTDPCAQGPNVACYSRVVGFGPLGGCDNVTNQYAALEDCEAEPAGPCSGLTRPCFPIYDGEADAASCPSSGCLAGGGEVPAGGICGYFGLERIAWGECCSGFAIVSCRGEYEPAEAYCDGAGAPVCGNGIQERREQCDDNNTINGDGCSSICRTEACWPANYEFYTSP